MRHYNLARLLLLLCLLMLLTSCAALKGGMYPKEVFLRYKLVPKETLRYQTVLQSKGITQVLKSDKPAFKREVEFTQTLNFTQTAQQRLDNFFKMELKYTDLDIDVTIDKEKKNNITENIKAARQSLLAGSVNYLKDERGQVKDIEGFSQIMQGFMKEKLLGEEKDVVVSTGIMRNLGQYIQRVVSQNIRPFPEKPVKVGYSWQDEIAQDIPFMGNAKSIYSAKLVGFKKVKGKLCAKIYFTHQMKSLAGKGQSYGGVDYSQEINGSGFHYFSLEGDKTAYIIKTTSEVTSSLVMTREMTSATGAKELVKNLTKMNITYTSELLE